MRIRKIAVIGSFAAGAALALAPLASADDLTSTIASEVAAANAIFQSDAALAGVPSTDFAPGAQGFDTILPADIGAVQDNGTTPFDFLIYGVDPKLAGLATDPGAFNVYNGALVEFDNAYNADLFGLLNGNTDLIPAADLFGTGSEIGTALGTGTDFGAATTFFDAGLADLAGFFGI